jgi:transposase
MTQTQHTSIVTVLHPICCGLDVHKKFGSACLITTDTMGKQMSRRFVPE